MSKAIDLLKQAVKEKGRLTEKPDFDSSNTESSLAGGTGKKLLWVNCLVFWVLFVFLFALSFKLFFVSSKNRSRVDNLFSRLEDRGKSLGRQRQLLDGHNRKMSIFSGEGWNNMGK